MQGTQDDFAQFVGGFSNRLRSVALHRVFGELALVGAVEARLEQRTTTPCPKLGQCHRAVTIGVDSLKCGPATELRTLELPEAQCPVLIEIGLS